MEVFEFWEFLFFPLYGDPSTKCISLKPSKSTETQRVEWKPYGFGFGICWDSGLAVI